MCTVAVMVVGVGEMSLFGIGVVGLGEVTVLTVEAEATCIAGRAGRVRYGKPPWPGQIAVAIEVIVLVYRVTLR